MVHTTIGIYPNGEYKVNGVHPLHLETHIEYNKDFRPGRILMVDGEIVYEGYGLEGLEEVIEKCKQIKRDTYSSSYH